MSIVVWASRKVGDCLCRFSKISESVSVSHTVGEIVQVIYDQARGREEEGATKRLPEGGWNVMRKDKWQLTHQGTVEVPGRNQRAGENRRKNCIWRSCGAAVVANDFLTLTISGYKTWNCAFIKMNQMSGSGIKVRLLSWCRCCRVQQAMLI